VNVVDVVLIAERVRVVDVGREEVVIRARKVQEAEGEAGVGGHEAVD